WTQLPLTSSRRTPSGSPARSRPGWPPGSACWPWPSPWWPATRSGSSCSGWPGSACCCWPRPTCCCAPGSPPTRRRCGSAPSPAPAGCPGRRWSGSTSTSTSGTAWPRGHWSWRPPATSSCSAAARWAPTRGTSPGTWPGSATRP
ncbi:MAG: hypothetical protein AVDCRST_MAG41-3584, partial [uncultured Corynebacteriales bacterium]